MFLADSSGQPVPCKDFGLTAPKLKKRFQLRGIGVDLDKTWRQAYYHELVFDAPAWAVWVKTIITDHPWVAMVLFGPGLIAEIFAILGLYGRKWALVMGGLHVVLHLGGDLRQAAHLLAKYRLSGHLFRQLALLVGAPPPARTRKVRLFCDGCSGVV